jgi:type I pantothenate kinase
VIGVTGSVAVGKSTVAGQLRAVLEHHPALRPVDVLSTDSFLFPNDRLAARGLSARKGFPESYDRPRLLAALAAIRAGSPAVEVPVYSHRDYDIVPGGHQVIAHPSVLIVEGLDVLQTGPGGDGADGAGSSVSDFLDWSIYVDAAEVDLARWHRERLLDIHRAGSGGASGFLGWFCSLSEDEAAAVADQTWWGINSVNLREHIAPTRGRASVILHKGPDHRMSHVHLRAQGGRDRHPSDRSGEAGVGE